MSNVRQRQKALRDLAIYFAEKGKVLTQQEYIDSKDKPLPFSGIRNVFRSYSKMVAMLARAQPELLEMTKPVKAKPTVVAPVAPVLTPVLEVVIPKVVAKPARAEKMDK